MAFDKHLLQQWVAGAEMRFRKRRKPLAGIAAIPLLGKLTAVAGTTQDYVLTEKVDLTKARDFQAQEAAEDILVASMQLPFPRTKRFGAFRLEIENTSWTPVANEPLHDANGRMSMAMLFLFSDRQNNWPV